MCMRPSKKLRSFTSTKLKGPFDGYDSLIHEVVNVRIMRSKQRLGFINVHGFYNKIKIMLVNVIEIGVRSILFIKKSDLE
jgi:hypothetical protein